MSKMSREQIEQNNIAMRYLRKQLSADDEAEFEAYLLEHPELIESLEVDAVFTKHIQATQQVVNLKEHRLKKMFASHALTAFGSAAACALFFLTVQPSPEDTFDYAAGSLQEIVFEGDYRNFGVTQEKSKNTANVTTMSDFVVLKMPVSADFDIQNQAYVVITQADSDEELVRVENLQVSEFGDVALVLPYAFAQRKNLQIKLYNRETNTLDAEFSLNTQVQ
ncbi:hypothetical protein [Agaribacter flavus]|uniref:Uncharacterized protein n=1 Tax=Agaribacter flavus TaxID=1902781 RepID=A0ABV7FTM4_9ALTE